MSVLVTGGAGFIGSHMALELLDAGEDVIVLDNLSTGFRWAVPDEARFVEGDVGDQNLVRDLLERNATKRIGCAFAVSRSMVSVISFELP